MSLKKAICFILFAAAVLMTPFALNRCQPDNLGHIWAEGGAPTSPPIPLDAAFDSPQLYAEGGAPTPPPIPLA